MTGGGRARAVALGVALGAAAGVPSPAAARNPMQLRGGLTLDSHLVAGVGVGLEQVAPWRARLDLGADVGFADDRSLGATADFGFGWPITDALSIDATVGGGKRGDDPTWRVRLPVAYDLWVRLELAPEYGDRGFGVAARVTVPLYDTR